MLIGRPSPYIPPSVSGASAASPSAPGKRNAPVDFAAALSSVAQPPTSVVDDAQRYAPRAGNPLSYLTPSDRQLLAATTGYNVSSDGVVQNPGRHPVDPLIAVMAIERQTGKLQGEVTPSYLSDLFSKYKNDSVVGGSLTDAVLNRALDFLASGVNRRAHEAPTRSVDTRL